MKKYDENNIKWRTWQIKVGWKYILYDIQKDSVHLTDVIRLDKDSMH